MMIEGVARDVCGDDHCTCSQVQDSTAIAVQYGRMIVKSIILKSPDMNMKVCGIILPCVKATDTDSDEVTRIGFISLC